VPTSTAARVSLPADDRRTPASCQPVRYVHGLLLGQGLAWLGLAGAGLAAWLLHRPTGLNLIGDGSRVLWSGAQLLGIAIAACLGSAEVRMACRLRGGQPRLLLAAAIGFQGVMLAAALILGAFVLTVGGSLLELLALGGLAVLLRPRSTRCPSSPAARAAGRSRPARLRR
jgi:hypothetical protein